MVFKVRKLLLPRGALERRWQLGRLGTWWQLEVPVRQEEEASIRRTAQGEDILLLAGGHVHVHKPHVVEVPSVVVRVQKPHALLQVSERVAHVAAVAGLRQIHDDAA
eukprot:4293078-Prymnesium_polylepis.4